MRLKTALLGAAIALAAATSARAGVVIEQDQSQSMGDKSRTMHQTIMVEGNKQKIINDKVTIITDLDAKKRYRIDDRTKSYRAMDFPPTHVPPHAAAGTTSTLEYKKSGNTRTVANQKCQEYTGAGQVTQGDFTLTECFSTSAPGAAEFTAFTKKEAAAMKDMPMGGLSANQPDGIPMQLESSAKLGRFNMTNIPKEQQDKILKMLAARPPVITKTVVTSVVAKDIPNDAFEVPAGYTEKAMTMMPGMAAMMGKKPGGATMSLSPSAPVGSAAVPAPATSPAESAAPKSN